MLHHERFIGEQIRANLGMARIAQGTGELNFVSAKVSLPIEGHPCDNPEQCPQYAKR